MSDTFYHNLPNGVQIVHRKTTSPVVYVGIMVGAGTRHELPNENGMAHYIEHCVFKGTEHYTARQIINHIEGIGGEINAYTTKEETTFYAATLSNHFRTTLHLLAEMVLHPTFSKKETDKEVTVILDEIESYNDSPSELIYDDFENMIFEGSSLAMPILGTKKTLHRISKSPDIALGWMHQHYRPLLLDSNKKRSISINTSIPFIAHIAKHIPATKPATQAKLIKYLRSLPKSFA